MNLTRLVRSGAPSGLAGLYSLTDVAGLGLGLAVVRTIVEAHGGAVRLESRPGHGSAFVLELPLQRSVPAGA